MVEQAGYPLDVGWIFRVAAQDLGVLAARVAHDPFRERLDALVGEVTEHVAVERLADLERLDRRASLLAARALIQQPARPCVELEVVDLEPLAGHRRADGADATADHP
jgi:hypothetical protein